MKIKLKPCPFCGGAAKLDDIEIYYVVQGKYGHACFVVTCGNRDCGAQVTAYNRTGGPLPYETMAEKAAEKWNRRA